MTKDEIQKAAEKHAREVYGSRAGGKSISHFSVTNTDCYDSFIAGYEAAREEIEKPLFVMIARACAIIDEGLYKAQQKEWIASFRQDLESLRKECET